MSDSPLFESSHLKESISGKPLAERMRPRTLEEFIGQDAIIGPGRLLRRSIQKDRLSSLIFSGPPGTGKTTLARVIAGTTKRRFVTLNAVLDGVQAVRSSVEEARRSIELYDRHTILFVDEVHRWNKAQQDALLPWVENGTIVLIGATTENPFFEVNKALVSRSRIFLLAPLSDDDLMAVARQALADSERGYGTWKITFEPGALEHLVHTASGDARNLLNALELAVETSLENWPPPDQAEIMVSATAAAESIQKRALLYDKDGDYHYDAISAFIKSLRGSDPDAALYWLARMVHSGEDPSFILRRMLISACEDVGLADPNAIQVVESCARAFERIGMPEGQYHLAHAALYLATAPKSNSALGYFDALATVEAESAEVPDHLKDSSRDAKGFGHGEGYKYPHAFREHWVAQDYLPESMAGKVFYRPGSLGHEGSLRDNILARKEAQLAASDMSAAGPAGTNQTFSYCEGADRTLEWMGRSDGEEAQTILAIRSGLFERAAVQRHERVLVFERFRGLYTREALRKAPEGTVVAIVPDEATRDTILRFADFLEEIQRPAILVHPMPESEQDCSILAESVFRESACPRFDLVVGADMLCRARKPELLAASLALSFAGARFLFCERSSAEGGRLSESLGSSFADRELAGSFTNFEKKFYENDDPEKFGWRSADLRSRLEDATIQGLKVDIVRMESNRTILKQNINAWFSPDSSYGAAMRASLGIPISESICKACHDSVRTSAIVPWAQTVAYASFQSPVAGLDIK